MADRGARYTLLLLAESFAICRLPAAAPLPDWAAGSFLSLTRTRDELSVVCAAQVVPPETQATTGWRCLKVEGPFDLENTVGVLAALAVPLAEAGVSIFVVSTYDTDYLLIQGKSLARASDVLAAAGHMVRLPADR